MNNLTKEVGSHEKKTAADITCIKNDKIESANI